MTLTRAGVLGVWCAIAGCSAPELSVESILTRQNAALQKLPAEDKARLLSSNQPLAVAPAAEMPPPGILELSEARRIALSANPDVHVVRARIESALARIAEARSFYFPQIALLHDSTRTFQTPSRRTRITTPISPFNTIPDLTQQTSIIDLITSLGGSLLGRQSVDTKNTNSYSDHSTTFNVTWTLFDGFAREARLMSTKHSYSAAAQALADVERLIVQAIDAAYYQTQLGQEQLRIALADEQFGREQLADAQRQFDAGKITKAGVLNFEVRVRTAQANVVAALGVRDTGRVLLAELMGLPASLLDDSVQLAPLEDETNQEMKAPETEVWIDKALESRPDLAQAEHNANAQAENVNFAKGQFSPELLVNGSYGFQRLGNLEYGKDDQASAVALELRWELFTGGFRTAQLRRSQAEWWEAKAALQRKRLEVASDVRSSMVDLKNAQEQVRLQRVNLESAKENRRIVQTEYSSGKASLVRLNEAQRDLVQTDAELARARIRLRQAWSDLRAAAGAYRPSWMNDGENESDGPETPVDSGDAANQPAAP